MNHASNVAAIPIEVITAYSYLLIALGYGLRQVLEDKPQLLWPWALVSIFLLCGATRVTGFVGVPVPDGLVVAMHVALAPLSLAYGLGQLGYAFWPGLFDDDSLTAGAGEPEQRPAAQPAPAEPSHGRDLARELEKLQALTRGDAIA